MHSLFKKYVLAERYGGAVEIAAGVNPKTTVHEDENNPDEDLFSLCLNSYFALADGKELNTSVRLRLDDEGSQLSLYFTVSFRLEGEESPVAAFEFFMAITGWSRSSECFVRFTTDRVRAGSEELHEMASRMGLTENQREQLIPGGFSKALEYVRTLASFEWNHG